MAGEFQLRGFAAPISVEGGYQAAGDAAREAQIQRNAWSRSLREEFGNFAQRAHSRDLLEMQMDRADKRDALTRDYDRMARAVDFERRKDLTRLDYDMRSQLQGEEYEARMVEQRLKEAQKMREEAAYAQATGIVSAVFGEARANKAKDPFQRVDRPLADLHPQFMRKSDEELMRWFLDRNPGQDEQWAKDQVKAVKRPGGAMYLAPGLLDPVVQRAMGIAQQSGVDSEAVRKAVADYLEPYKDLPSGYSAARDALVEKYDKGLNQHFRPETQKEASEGNALEMLMQQVQGTKQNVPGAYPQTGTQATAKPGFDPNGQLMVPPQSTEPGIVDMPNDLTNPKAKPGDVISATYGEVAPVKLQSSLLKEVGLSSTALMPRDPSGASSNWLNRLDERNVQLEPIVNREGMVTGVRIKGNVDDLRSENPQGLRDMENALNSYDGLLSVVGYMLRPGGTREEQQAAARLRVKHTPTNEHSASNPRVPESKNYISDAFKAFE